MTDKKTEKLNDAELDQVTGGRTGHAAVSNTVGYRRRKGTANAGAVSTIINGEAGNRATKRLSKTDKNIAAQSGDGSI